MWSSGQIIDAETDGPQHEMAREPVVEFSAETINCMVYHHLPVY